MANKPAFIRLPNTPTLVSLAVLILLPIIYFLPAMQGKSLTGHDDVSARAMRKSAQDEWKAEGEQPYWSGSMFSGMPTYPFMGGDRKGSIVGKAWPIFSDILPFPVGSAILGMIMSFLLLRHFRVPHALAVAGAVAFCFMNYNLVIVNAGHNVKYINLMMVPGVFLGIVRAYERQYLVGAVLVGIFMALMFNVQHVQMIYYMLFVVFFYVVHRAIQAFKEKALKSFAIASGALLLGSLVGLGSAAIIIMPLQDYTPLSYRGPSELSTSTKVLRGDVQEPVKQVKEAGLDTSYAYQWSNNRLELFTLLVPDFYGGPPARKFDKDHAVYEQLGPGVANQIVQQTGGMWRSNFGAQGNQAGPFYIGAVVIFLFVVGLILVRSGSKYGLLYAVLLGLMLSLGRNSYSLLEAGLVLALPLVFMFTYKRLEDRLRPPVYGLALLGVGILLLGLIDASPASSYKISDLFFFNLPLYNRFRVPGSVLVIVAMAVPWLAFMGARELFNSEHTRKEKLLAIYIGAGLTAGLSLIIALAPGVFHSSFLLPQETAQMSQSPQLGQYFAAIAAERESLVQTSALRSLVLILIVAGLFWAYVQQRLKDTLTVSIAVAAVVAFDMFAINWRYLSHDDFVSQASFQQEFAGYPADQVIAPEYQKQDVHFRVFPMTRNPFNDAMSSWYLRSIGGYSAAKIKRYQQLADIHLLNPNNKRRYYGIKQQGGITPYDITPQVANMLNMKYMLTQAQFANQLRIPQYQLVRVAGPEAIYLNKQNLGPAWMVREVKVVDSPDSALMKLHDINTAKTAIIEAKQKDKLKSYAKDSIGLNEQIKLTFYSNDVLKYNYKSDKQRFVVFSEIYHPNGWNAYIDGKPAEILHTNFVLRGLIVTAGEHEIVMKFEPEVIETASTISLICSLLLVGGVLAIVALRFRDYKREADLAIKTDSSDDADVEESDDNA